MILRRIRVSFKSAHNDSYGPRIHDFRASSCTERARGSLSLKTAQDIAGADKRVSMFFVQQRPDTETVRNETVKLLSTV